MKDNVRPVRMCPLCGRLYSEPSALSRTDNETFICPDCGTRQALESIGVEAAEREQIIAIIHGTRGNE